MSKHDLNRIHFKLYHLHDASILKLINTTTVYSHPVGGQLHHSMAPVACPLNILRDYVKIYIQIEVKWWTNVLIVACYNLKSGAMP